MVLLVEGNDASAQNFFQGDLVGLQGGVKVDQRLLQIQQLDELLVPLGLIELALHIVIDLIDLLEVLEEPLRHLQQQVEDEAGLFLG